MKEMDIEHIRVSGDIREKLEKKHGVLVSEVEQVMENEDSPVWIRKSPKVPGRYIIYGQTFGGRYLKIVIKPLGKGSVDVRTALEMDSGERRDYKKLLERRG